MLHEPRAQPLDVEVHVLCEALRDAEPDRVGRQRDRTMLVERIVRHLDQRVYVGA
jgi:hypothetical protein